MRLHTLVAAVFAVAHSVLIAADFETIDVPLSPSESIYRVQIAAKIDQSEAEETKARALEAGYFPVFIVHETPYYRVNVGQLDNYPDAHEMKDDLRANDFEGAFVVTEKNTDKVKAQPAQLTGSANPYGVKAFPPILSVQKSALTPAAADLLLSHETIVQLDNEAIRGALKPVIDSKPSTDPAKGYALYYYALASERTGKAADVRMAANVLSKIAAGKIAAPGDYQRKAAIQAADIVHYNQKTYYNAYRMYKLLLASDWLQGQSRAEVQAELAATLLEMMDSEKGNPPDVRHELQELYARMSDDFPEPKARVELMYSETFFWEKEAGGIPIALKYAQLIQNKYFLFPQILSQAIWNEAVALERLGRIEEAREVLLAAFQVKVPEAQAFRNRLNPFSMEKRISKFMVRLNKKLDDSQLKAMWIENETSIEMTTPSMQMMRVPGLQ